MGAAFCCCASGKETRLIRSRYKNIRVIKINIIKGKKRKQRRIETISNRVRGGKRKKMGGRKRKKQKFETRQKKIEFRTDLSLSLSILEIVSARVWLCKRSFDVHQCIGCRGGQFFLSSCFTRIKNREKGRNYS